MWDFGDGIKHTPGKGLETPDGFIPDSQLRGKAVTAVQKQAEPLKQPEGYPSWVCFACLVAGVVIGYFFRR